MVMMASTMAAIYAFKYLTGKDLWTLESYPYVSGGNRHKNSHGHGSASGVTISGCFTVPEAGTGSQ